MNSLFHSGSTPKVRGGGVGGASGLVLYAAVFVLRGIILEFLIRDSRFCFLFLLGSEQRRDNLSELEIAQAFLND